MIVISGALVLVALVLLVLGVTGPDLDLVYGSIAVSLVSLVFLVLGIVQRRGEVLPGAGRPTGSQAPPPVDQEAPAPSAPVARLSDPPAKGVETDADPTVAPVVGPDRSGSARLPAPEPESADTSGTVLVVTNRPRYHVAGCRYLAGKTPESRDVSDAVAQGFSPCGVCQPDDVLRGAVVPAAALLPSAEPPTGSTPERAPRVAAPRGQPVPRTPAEQVVVIPDRNRYHRAECRHVRGLAGAETLAPDAAVQQGYSACGVCRP